MLLKHYTVNLSILLCLLAASCSTLNAVYDFDEVAKFEHYKTYNYVKGIETNLSQLDDKRFYKKLDSMLTMKGFEFKNEADIYIDIHTGSQQIVNNNTLGVGVGGGGGNVGVGISGGIPLGGTQVQEYFLFEFLDGHNHSIVWQAEVTGTRRLKISPQQRDLYLEKIINKALEGYPPAK